MSTPADSTQRLRLGLEIWACTRRIRKQLMTARAHEIADTIVQLPTDCAPAHILSRLKPIIGTSNPKLKRASPLPMIADEHGHPVTTKHDLCRRWVEFFSLMEGGERVTKEALREQWREGLAHFIQQELHLSPDDIPTLTDLEIAFRRVRPHKAVGADNVPPELCHLYPTRLARAVYGQLLKLCTHGQEALIHKGGLLVAAWKRKGSQMACESYRSLLISSHVAKTVHRAVRSHQSQTYESFLQAEQIGGRKAIPVTMGVHFIRAAARAARLSKQSHALIFLDLREAFYRVLRPLSIGGPIPDELLALVAARLHLPAEALHDLQQLLRDPSGTERANMAPHQRRTLQALHTHTHFWMHGQDDRIHTRLGSRPGDPFADVVFGYMFARILTEVEQKLDAIGVLETIEDVTATGLYPSSDKNDVVKHTMLGPTWMDDLCITITGATAEGVESRASAAASILLEVCTAHGVSPNLDKGKSEVLFSF